MKTFSSFFTFMLLSYSTFAQVIDSLNHILASGELSDIEKISLQVQLSIEHNRLGHPDKAIDMLDKIDKQTITVDSVKWNYLSSFTRAFLLKGDFIKALDYGFQLEVLAEEENKYLTKQFNAGEVDFKSAHKTAIVYTMIGEIIRKTGDYEKALKYALKAKAIAEQAKDSVNLAANYNNFGIIFNRLKEFDKAKENYLKALKINSQLTTNPFGIASNNNNLGLIHRTKKEFDSALIRFNLALEYIESPYGTATILNNIAGVYYDLEKYDSSLVIHQKALKIQLENGFDDQISLSKINIGGVMTKMNKYQESISITKEAYDENLDRKNIELLKNASEVLANTYEEMGDFENSLFFHRKFKFYQDSIFNENKKTAIVNHQLNFEVLEKEKENELLQQQSEHDQDTLQLYYLILSIGTMLFIATLLVFYLVLKRKKMKQALVQQELEIQASEKKLLEKELGFKNNELVNFALQIVEKNEFMRRVENEISKISKNGHKNNDQIKALASQLKTNHFINKHQQEFDAHVNSVNSSFYQKLQDRFPSMTQNDKRLAALLRLQLSSKEISSILGISPKSVDMNRYRLRKKLELESEDNLIEFLNGL